MKVKVKVSFERGMMRVSDACYNILVEMTDEIALAMLRERGLGIIAPHAKPGDVAFIAAAHQADPARQVRVSLRGVHEFTAADLARIADVGGMLPELLEAIAARSV